MAYFHNFDSGAFESIVETYNMEVPTLANNTIYTEKVRIDSGSLVGSLSKDKRSEVSAFDTFSVDSDKLMVAFSPQHIINEDIIEAIGGVTIDDYIGAYSNIKKSEYSDLKWLSRQYWQKYKNRNDFTAYINLISVFDFSVFDQIRQTLPARSNPILGLVIEPNILERSKIDGTGRELAGSTNFSIDTNEISSSCAVIPVYSRNEATFRVVGDQDGEVQDIFDDIDIEPVIPALVQDKKGSIIGLTPGTTLDIGDKKVTLPISPEPVLDISDKKTVLPGLDPITNINLNNKQGSVLISEPDTSLSVSDKKTTVEILPKTDIQLSDKLGTVPVIQPETELSVSDKKTTVEILPKTNIEFSEKNGTVSGINPETEVLVSEKDATISNLITDTNLVYSKNVANLDNLASDTVLEYKSKTSLIEIGSENLETTYNGKNALISEPVSKVLETNYTSINTSVGNTSNILIKNIIGTYNSLQEFGSFDVNVSSTYNRNNLIYSSSAPDVGYGTNWTTQTNLSYKALSFMQVIDSYRTDNFYKKYYLYYSSPMKYDAKNPSSSSLGPSTVQNQHNLATSVRRHRFEGSKLTGPDINVGSDETLDGTPVVEVYIVGSTEIIYRSYENGGNLTTGI